MKKLIFVRTLHKVLSALQSIHFTCAELNLSRTVDVAAFRVWDPIRDVNAATTARFQNVKSQAQSGL